MAKSWQAVADHLREAIAEGRYAPGGRLPSGNDLMEEFGVSRQTVQTAVDRLRDEGLVLSVNGVGWFVTERRPVIRLARNRLSRAEWQAGRGPFMSDAQASGFEAAVTVKIRREPATVDVAGWLDVDPGTQVVVRERIMRADGKVVQLATSFLPVQIAGGSQIEQADTGPGGTYARLAELGHAPDRFTEAVSARRAAADEAPLLQVAVGAPVLAVTRVAYDASGHAVEVNRMILHADLYELIYQIDAG
jgi:GntR family transcriptional regulator